jgi:competence protein ComEC
MRRLVVLLFALAWAAPGHAQQLALHFLDVGQGDAAVLITPEHRVLLVDAGRNGAVTAQYLHQLGVDTIDLLVVSHDHDDHMGGVPGVLAEFPVRNFMSNGVPSARSYRLYEWLAREGGARYLEATSRTITLGSVRIRVLPPPDERLRLGRTDQNNRSIGLLIQYGSFRALLTGDSQVEELGYWLAVDSVPEVRVLKAAHHGSRNGATPDWIARTRPGLVVVSVGRNGYGHPSPEVVAAWCSAGAMVLRTDWNGSITVRADSTGAATVETANGSATNTPPASACGGAR